MLASTAVEEEIVIYIIVEISLLLSTPCFLKIFCIGLLSH